VNEEDEAEEGHALINQREQQIREASR